MHASDIALAWPDKLRELLTQSPIVSNLKVEGAQQSGNYVDAMVEFTVAGEPHFLLVDLRSAGTPRQVESVVARMGHMKFGSSVLTRLMLVAPFISTSARQALEKYDMSWLDMTGNARISFPKLFMKVHATDKDPTVTKRDQRSLFSPKTARVIKHLLIAPIPAASGRELAQMLRISEGLISKTRQTLLDQHWAEVVQDGWLRLTDPDAVLDAWRDYGDTPHVAFRGYTSMRGKDLDAALSAAFEEIYRMPTPGDHEGFALTDGPESAPRLALTSHSVARREAPFLRNSGEYLYANAKGLDVLWRHVKALPVVSGENIVVYAPKDQGLWFDLELAGPLIYADKVQTYLDLLVTGARGIEAAEHWRSLKLAGSALKAGDI